MMRIRTLGVVFSFVVLGIAQTGLAEQAFVGVEKAKVRACPATTCDGFFKLPLNTQVAVLARMNGFAEVTMPDGRKGWVLASDLSGQATAPVERTRIPKGGDDSHHHHDAASPGDAPSVPTIEAKHPDHADHHDVSKKSFKHHDDDEIAAGENAYVRRAKIALRDMAGDGGEAVARLEGGAKVLVNELTGDWARVTASGGAEGYVQAEDLRRQEPVKWHSQRENITYQECLGKHCKGKEAKHVDVKDALIEIDRGGPDNAFIYVQMPGDVYGWVPIAYMREWREKFD